MGASPLLVVSGIMAVFIWITCVHSIDEGNVGIYWRGGALIEGVGEPGYNFKLPLITTVAQVQTTVQTDSIENIQCGTSGGVVLDFKKIEVVNRLNKKLAWQTIKNYTLNYDKTWIFDKIGHEINEFCSKHTVKEVYIEKFDQLDESLIRRLSSVCKKWAPGIEIISVRITKPTLPTELRQNYIDMVLKKTELFIVRETQKLNMLKAETTKIKDEIEAQTESDISKINMEKLIMVQEAKKKIADIDNEIYLSMKKVEADSIAYKLEKKTKTNEQKLSKEFLQHEAIKSIGQNKLKYFGTSIKQFFEDNRDFQDKEI